jgi:hypothetical protein
MGKLIRSDQGDGSTLLIRLQADCPKIVKAFSKLHVNEYNNGPT